MKIVMGMLAAYTGIYTEEAHRHEKTEPLTVAFEFVSLYVLLLTLPRARVLWTEPDPREFGGDMSLVPGLRREI